MKTAVTNPAMLGNVLQQSRMSQKISQRDLAKILGVSQKWIWEMEQGKPGILMNRLFEIFETLGITITAEYKSDGKIRPKKIPEPEKQPDGNNRQEAKQLIQTLDFLGQTENIKGFASTFIFSVLTDKQKHASTTLQDIVSELLSWQCTVFPDEKAAQDFIFDSLQSHSITVNNAVSGDEADSKLKSDISASITNLLLGLPAGG